MNCPRLATDRIITASWTACLGGVPSFATQSRGGQGARAIGTQSARDFFLRLIPEKMATETTNSFLVAVPTHTSEHGEDVLRR